MVRIRQCPLDLIPAGLGNNLPVFNAGPARIWGLTAFILAGFLNTCLFPEFSKL
jgi:hypothetical protein